MGGCTVIKAPCGLPVADPPSLAEEQNCTLVRNFIEQVWNHAWTAAENAQFLQEKQGGNHEFVPPAVAAALGQFCSPATIRHRQAANGDPIRSGGPGDYENCINLVHEVMPDLRIEILHVVGQDDRVFAQIRLSGTHRRLDGNGTKLGAFGLPDTSWSFDLQTATLYRIENGRIAEDWLLYGARPTFR